MVRHPNWRLRRCVGRDFLLPKLDPIGPVRSEICQEPAVRTEYGSQLLYVLFCDWMCVTAASTDNPNPSASWALSHASHECDLFSVFCPTRVVHKWTRKIGNP